MTESQLVYCPYCGEENEIEIDLSAGKKQSYEEDCQVCCRPWTVVVKIGAEGEVMVNLKTEEEL